MRTLIIWSNELILSCFIGLWLFMVYFPADIEFKTLYLVPMFCVYLIGAFLIDALTISLKRKYKAQ
jgi:hypothetical protein